MSLRQRQGKQLAAASSADALDLLPPHSKCRQQKKRLTPHWLRPKRSEVQERSPDFCLRPSASIRSRREAGTEAHRTGLKSVLKNSLPPLRAEAAPTQSS